MPSSSLKPGKEGGGNKQNQVTMAVLGANKRSKASFKKRGKRNKENVEPPLEPAAVGKFLQKSKVELCSLEKRLRCFRHKIGESKEELTR